MTSISNNLRLIEESWINDTANFNISTVGQSLFYIKKVRYWFHLGN